jgi:5,10-methylenetetrahydromethanopterin reductase
VSERPEAIARPRFGIVLLPESLAGFGDLCHETEGTGFDLLGVADSQSVFRELYVALTVAALNTSRIRLGPLVTNPLTRHLVVTASAISSIDELSGGRAVLGIGSGDSAIYTIGAPPATVAGLEDSIATLGQLTSGVPIERHGRRWQVHRSARRVPLYLAAEGPRTLELAGRVADGVIVGLGLTPEVIRLSLAAIERGARTAGRSLADLDVWWFAKTNLADTRQSAVAPITMALAASANHAFRFTLEGKGVPADLHEKIKGLQREYNAHHHEIAGAGNALLTERWGLTEFLADRFGIVGTPDDCVAQIRRAMAAGAHQFVITGFVPEPRAFMRRWSREVAAAVSPRGESRSEDPDE